MTSSRVFKRAARLPARVRIRGGHVVTMNAKRETFEGDVVLEGERIVAIRRGSRARAGRGESVIDARECFVIPGLIQGHVHLCQTLFRGLADDLALLDWLQKKIWPFEHAHTPASLRASADVGLLEMQLSGTTAILDMATVRHTPSVLEAAEASGIRYWGGKCLMDRKGTAGPLYQDTRSSLNETEGLIRDWRGRSPLVRYALCPRFAISCTRELLEATQALQAREGLLVHTHASENRDEIALVRKMTGLDNISYFEKLGLLNPRTVIAHGVHLTGKEALAMVRTRTSLAHCPSSNLKLGSGVAPIGDYLRLGMNVCLGADGAPCNNSLDPFLEMRLAALIQKPSKGPQEIRAQDAFEMATLRGARALGAEAEIGSLEEGKRADVVVVARTHASVATVRDPYSALVYSCLGRDVRDVWVDGREVVRGGEHLRIDAAETLARARRELRKLLGRVEAK